jgi:alkanesulfonate monooxygenase SsuD/methylene tetrahydromethanopterin reductase-like flavin-dependent oxidoreductase (luciferase family)
VQFGVFQVLPVQQPHPELMVGGSGEKVTLRIAARHADHWNAWGGPEILARKSQVLEAHCAAVGRDPATLRRSANMLLRITDDRAEVERLRGEVMRCLKRDEAAAGDTLLAGSVAEVQDKLARLREAGVTTLFVPTLLMPPDPRPQLDRFIGEVAPAFR